MAASAPQRADHLAKMLALALLLIGTSMNGVRSQEDNIVTDVMPTMHAEDYIRGDMIPVVTPSDSGNEKFTVLFDLNKPVEQTTLAPTTEQTIDEDETTGAEGEAADEGQVTLDMYPDQPQIEEQQTPAPPPGRGDGPDNIPRQGDVVCVGKEAIREKNAVNLKLAHSSNCENTKVRIQSVLDELCGEDCKLELYQEDNTDQILVSGQYVEDDIKGMVNKFNNDNIKDKAGVKEAVPHWRRSSKLVLISLLLTGLLLAALLVAGYYFKVHHKNSKGVRLAESYQVDEENQANTLVSVAPLPQESLDKVTANGDSPPENGTNPNPSPTTNGHSSATQAPVADTEM